MTDRDQIIGAAAREIDAYYPSLYGQLRADAKDVAVVAYDAMVTLIRQAIAEEIATELERIADDIDQRGDVPCPPEYEADEALDVLAVERDTAVAERDLLRAQKAEVLALCQDADLIPQDTWDHPAVKLADRIEAVYAKTEMPHAPAVTAVERPAGLETRERVDEASGAAEAPPWVQSLFAGGNGMEDDLNERLRPLAEWLKAPAPLRRPPPDRSWVEIEAGYHRETEARRAKEAERRKALPWWKRIFEVDQ